MSWVCSCVLLRGHCRGCDPFEPVCGESWGPRFIPLWVRVQVSFPHVCPVSPVIHSHGMPFHLFSSLICQQCFMVFSVQVLHCFVTFYLCVLLFPVLLWMVPFSGLRFHARRLGWVCWPCAGSLPRCGVAVSVMGPVYCLCSHVFCTWMWLPFGLFSLDPFCSTFLPGCLARPSPDSSSSLVALWPSEFVSVCDVECGVGCASLLACLPHILSVFNPPKPQAACVRQV